MRLPIPRWLVRRLIARAQRTPYFHLANRDGTPYMDRFWLIPYNKWGIAARLHHIRSSDEAGQGDFHDHPWPYLSIILEGTYIEHTLELDGYDSMGYDVWIQRRHVFSEGDVILRGHTHKHRLELLADPDSPRKEVREPFEHDGLKGIIHRFVCTTERPVWTLFITFGGKKHDWGFFKPPHYAKIPHDDYLAHAGYRDEKLFAKKGYE